MTNYSPIKYLVIQNFRNIGEVTIDFTESPIITLMGDNESGKTSVVKAFGVCAKHVDPRSQKDYIRDGTNEFGVAIILEDGTKIVRQKGTTTSSNRYRVVYPDGKVWEAQKLENEVPAAVQQVMGLIEEPETKELIHIRTYEDQLLFVVTPASTNYKVMYDALKISQLTRAIKAGSTEANSLKSKINQAETSVNTLRKSIADIKIFDIEPLINIKNKLIQQKAELNKINKIFELKSDIEQKKKELGALDLINTYSVKEIDVYEAEKVNRIGDILNNISNLKSKLSAYSDVDNLEPLETDLVAKLENAYSQINNLRQVTEQSKNYVDLDKLEPISELEINNFDRIIETLNKLKLNRRLEEIYSQDIEEIKSTDLGSIEKFDRVINLRDTITNYGNGLVQIDDYIDKIINWMKAVGVATVSCPKCGESVVLDLDSINNN